MRARSLGQLGLKKPPEGPAYLLYDIETAPSLGWYWSAYKTNIIEEFKPWYLLSFAYKWLGAKGKPTFVGLNEDPEFFAYSDNDFYVAERLNALMDEADVVIAHNGNRFDQKKANSRFLANDIAQPSPYEEIDTYLEAKRSLGEASNSLAALAHHFGLAEKLPTMGFAMWKGCIENEAHWWKMMKKYNVQDVETLEQWYLKLRPYMGRPGRRAHPNRGLWQKGDLVCPKCGSDRTQIRKWHRTSVSEFPSVFCHNCEGYTRIRERKSQRDGQFVRAL